MKILNVIMHMDAVTGGGSVERTFQMSHFLARIGEECSVLTTDSGLTAERLNTLAGINVVALPCLNKRFYIPRFSYARIKKLVSAVDVIHLMNHWTFLNALVYFIAKKLNKPYVVCAAGSLPIYGRSKTFKKLYNLLIGKMIIRNASFCIAISSDEIEHFKSYGVEADKIIIIPNGITADNLMSKDDALFRRKFKLSDNRIILFAGRLNKIKGPDLLLRAFCNLKEELHNYQLVFIGPDDGMLPMLKEIVSTNELQNRVHFLGYLMGEDKSYAYNSSELLVIPSRHEAMSIVVLEAGVIGKPVLLTDQCGFDSVATIDGGKVVPASVEGLRQGLIELLDGSDRLEAMGKNLKKFVNENFLWDSLVSKYVNLYKRILNNDKKYHKNNVNSI